MINGYIKLHRAFLKWYGISSPTRVSLWINILLLANHAPNKWIFKGNPYTVNRGQFITSRKSLAEVTGINESMVERLLKEFEKEGQIEQQTSNRSRLISILNYNQYQSFEQQLGQQMNNRRTTGEQQMNTNNNDKNDKKKKKDTKVFDFEAVWSKYPSGKKQGVKLAKGYFYTSVKTDKDFENIRKALDNYLEYIKTIENPKYILKGCNWFDDWESWIDYEESNFKQKTVSM